MSSEDIVLELEKRDAVGKGLNALRSEGTIPAVIHNHGKESIIVMAPTIAMNKVYQQAGKTQPVNLKVGKETYLAIIKDADFDPKKNLLRHVVFNAVRQDQPVEAQVPIVLDGEEIPAEKAGLLVIPTLEHVTIEALPKDLIDSLSVDVTKLAEIGDKLHVSDIVVPSGVTIKEEPEQTIVVVEQPKAQMSEEAAEESEEGEATEEGASAETADSSEGTEEPKES
ncbi:50S ribosomal protein L25 [Candidatus Saccharibacteria bacterium]|nr:50S ribosomal protein L25 [Candidatus Saccharibacteria bacterium]